MKSTYPPLVSTMRAATRGDREAFTRALRACEPQAMFSTAARHKCAPLLLEAFGAFRIHEPGLLPLRALLQQYAGAALASAATTVPQIEAIAQAFNAACIPHAFLKTAGRLYAGDTRARWVMTADIDVLVPAVHADAAEQALLQKGYRSSANALEAATYRKQHHHLAPLQAPDGGKMVEIHTALGLAEMFATRTDWAGLERYLEPSDAQRPYTYAFGPAARGLHLMMHGVGLYRLADAVHLARELRQHPQLHGELAAIAARDAKQRIAMRAVLALAADFAGCAAAVDRETQRYLDWAIWREDLAPAIRLRSHLVDAWFANGGSLRGHATPLALPPQRAYDGTRTPPLARYGAITGRALIALAACGHYGLMRYAGRR